MWEVQLFVHTVGRWVIVRPELKIFDMFGEVRVFLEFRQPKFAFA
jgi:hypothetical protein